MQVRSTWQCIILMIVILFGLTACTSNVRTPGSKDGPIQHGQYTVRKGDTLAMVANRIGYAPAQLARINRLNTPYVIFPGQILYFSERSKYINSPLMAKDTKKPVTKKSTKMASKIPHFSTHHKIRWQWPVRGAIIRCYGANSKGIDIAGKLNTTIKAAAAGTVVYSGNALKGYGNFLIIKHDEDFLSAYGHNKELMVKEGERINLGQEIAKMGQSEADRVKLHFEIRYKGQPIDPIKYLPKR